MSTSQRRLATGVIEQLLQSPQQFHFFQAIRLLEQWLGEARIASGDTSSSAPLQRINFRNTLSLAFPTSEIEGMTVALRECVDVAGQSNSAGIHASTQDNRIAPQDVERVDLTPAFMGLLGVTGALPLYYTEVLAQRESEHKDRAARAFLDIFSHRSVALFYQAWQKHRLAAHYATNPSRHFLPEVMALAGLGHTGLKDRLKAADGGVPDQALAFHASTLQRRTLSARQMEQVLHSYLKVPVKVEQFVGKWYRLPEAAQSHLGMLGAQAGKANGALSSGVLGRSAMLGERVWQRDLRMRIVLGPLAHRDMQRFLPGGAGAAALKEWLTLLNGVALEYEINLTLKRDAVEGSTLASSRQAQRGCLGWDTFLQTREASADRSDVRYDIHAAA